MDTRTDYIKDLLTRFYDGQTSPAEEQELREFFSGAESMPASMEADRRMFAALDGAIAPIAAPDCLEGRILAAVDAAETLRRRPERAGRVRTWWAAACIAVITVTAALLMLPRLNNPDSATAPGNDKALTVTDTHPAPQPPVIVGNPTQPSPTVRPQQQKPRRSRRHVQPAPSPAPETLTDEEVLALEAGLRALAMAGDKIAYASERVASAGERVHDINANLQTILQ